MTYYVRSDQITEVTGALVEPVSLNEMKVHCRVEDTNDHDTILNTMIKAVRAWVEKEYQIILVRRTYRADVEGFASTFRLPRPPLASLSSVKYYNTSSPQALTTLATTYYRTDPGRGEIYLDVSSPILPSVSTRHDAVQITYVAGYAPSTDSPADHAGNVPEAIRAAIKLQVADLFENRETNTQLRMQQLPTTKMLLEPWRKL